MGYTKGNGKELRNMAVISLTKDNFNREVMECTTKVLIDFYADWCGPCQMVSPLVDEIAGERQDIKVCKVNVDEQPALAQAFSGHQHPHARRRGKRKAGTACRWCKTPRQTSSHCFNRSLFRIPHRKRYEQALSNLK